MLRKQRRQRNILKVIKHEKKISKELKLQQKKSRSDYISPGLAAADEEIQLNI